ncbi:MAG: putative TIM-barrel fold metal-dependent hydrolase [Acidimicrobiales bacterium]|nr:putative TIM-barrel fold metal-dependent hydrolase [Acidimicrobiales bacterium]
MRDGHRVLDADAHVVEPAIWGDALPAGAWPMDLPPTTPSVMCGDGAVIADQLEHGFDAPSYLRAMDAQGIDAVVLYPSMGLFVPFQPTLDATGSAAACRAYNDWMASYCATDPGRLAGVGLVPMIDPHLAAVVAAEAAALGLVGVLVRPNQLYGRNLGDAAYDPLYDAVAGSDVVLAVHEGLGVLAPTIGDRFPGSFSLRHACSHPMEQMASLASLFLEGALERHPSMRVAFLESGTGWLPYWLARLDGHREWMAATECAGLSLSPSEYFARQCAICTDPDDPLAAWVAGEVGADHVMWASDFPHPDALFPNAVDAFLKESHEHGLTGADLDAVLWSTPARFYRLDPRFSRR